MSKVDTIYKWVNENLGKVHFTKEQKITRVGLTVNKTTKNGEVTEDSTLSFTLDGGNIISLKDKWIDKIALADDKQSMIVSLTDETPFAIREYNDVFMLSNDPSLYDKEEEEMDEKSEMDEKWDTMVSNIANAADYAVKNDISVGEAFHQLFNKEEEKEWNTKEIKNGQGDTFTAPIVRIKGNSLVQNYIKNNKHGNLGIVYFNEKYGFGGNGNFAVHEKESLQHRSERFVIVTEGDKQHEEAPCLVLDENEEVRVLTPSWAVESGKPSILCAKGTDNDRFIIYPIIDYPTPIMGTLVETEKQFDNLFNFKTLGDNLSDDKYINLNKAAMNALFDGARKAKSGECKFYDGENDGCAAKNFKDVNQVTIPLSKIKVINFDNADEKTKEFVKKMLKESENFSRKVYGDAAVDATLKCMNNCKQPNLNESVKVLLGEEEADEKDKEEIAEAIANGSGCLEEVDDNEVDKHFKGVAEYMRKMKVSNIYFHLEEDGTVNCESRIISSYPKK